MAPRITNLQKVNELFKPDEDGCSRWVSTSEFEAAGLKWSANGNGRNGKFWGVKDYFWDDGRDGNTTTKIQMLRLDGKDISEKYGRSIAQRIHKEVRDAPGAYCVACFETSDLVTDHKNDLYNDARVLDTKTQVVGDFQCLCNRCNLKKRQVSKVTRQTGKRQPAPRIPGLDYYTEFIEGDENYNPDDIDAMKGTYWYDPVAYVAECKRRANEARDNENARLRVRDTKWGQRVAWHEARDKWFKAQLSAKDKRIAELEALLKERTTNSADDLSNLLGNMSV